MARSVKRTSYPASRNAHTTPAGYRAQPSMPPGTSSAAVSVASPGSSRDETIHCGLSRTDAVTYARNGSANGSTNPSL